MQPTTLQLRHFRESLERYMPREDMRPFTCSDNPYDCRIFLVGTNPATPLGKPLFYTYWSDSKGFCVINSRKIIQSKGENQGQPVVG